ncbi:hypothetical protein JCM5353_002641 [Sporobolomyces roseus]
MHSRPVAGGSSTTNNRGGPQHVRTTSSQSSSNTVRGQLAKRAELSSAYSALAAELTKTEIKSVGGYTLGKIIGQGTFGKVRLGVHRLTGTRVAIKQVSKSLPSNTSDPSSPLSLLTREIHHHRRLRHPHVLSLYELIATESSIYLVSELCAGGELFDYLVEKGRLSISETRTIFGELVVGIGYLHGEGVVHRDLKLENVLLDERCRVKIADLGFGREFERGKWMDTWVGTLGYCAPEVVSGKKYLGEEVDIWSLGVIFYALVTGSLPFDDDDEGIMKEMILKCEYEIPTWLDEDAADLIRNILVLDPLRRFSLKQILSHAFFTRPTPALTRRPTFSRSHSHSSSISSYHINTGQLAQEEFDHPPAILEQEENAYISSPSVGFLSSEETGHHRSHGGELARVTEGDETSQSSHLESGSQARTETSSPLTSVAGDAEVEEEIMSAVRAGKQRENENILEPVLARNESQMTLQDSISPLERSTLPVNPEHPSALPSPGRLSAPPSPVPPSRASFDTPSLRRNRSNSSSVHSLPFHSGSHGASTPHARTPARTKRRSIGSIISERLVSLIEEEPHLAAGTSPSALLLPPVDYLSLLLSTTHRDGLFSAMEEKEMLDKLEGLGFDTGQMVHSVNTSACDSTSATFWMLKRKIDEKEAARLEAEAIAANNLEMEKSVGGLSRNSSIEQRRKSSAGEKTDEVVLDLPKKSKEEEESTPTQDLFSTEKVQSPLSIKPPRSTPSPNSTTIVSSAPVEDRLEYFLGSHSSGAPPAPAVEYFPTIDPGSPTRRRTRSRDDLLLSPLSGHTNLVPLDSPLELSPGKSKNEEEVRSRRSRSGSVTLLARATSALNTLKGKDDDVPSDQQPSGLFRRKSSLPLDSLDTSNRTPPLPPTSLPSSPKRNSSSSPFRDPSTPPRPTSKQLIVSPAPSPSVSLADSVETFDTITSSHSSGKPRASASSTPMGSTSSKKGTKGSQLLANLKFWFGDGQKKRNKRTSPGRSTESSSFASGGAASIGRSQSLNGGYRSVPAQNGYVASPLRRPLPGSRRSSNASIAPLSRRSSVSSAHRTALHDQLARPQLAHHRRRSDSSRTSISGGEHSRPQSVRSFNGGQNQPGSPSDPPHSARRHRHTKAPSTSSTGSFGGKEAVYRRPPTTTTVRRRHPSHGRHNHRRSASGASSIRTHRSSTSSIGEGGSDEDAFGEAGEAPILEEDETEDRELQKQEPPIDETAKAEARLRALRTLSGDFSAAPVTSSSSSSSSSSAPPASTHLARPVLTHHSSSRASSRSDNSSLTRSQQPHATFSAHKSTHLFGSPLQPHSHLASSSSPSSTIKKTIPPPRPPLRDVFASKSNFGESDWVDEDELEGYGGGLGQAKTTTNLNGNVVEGSSSLLGTVDETRAIGGAGSGDSPIAEKTFVGGGGMSLFEGRYAGVSGSSTAAGGGGRGVRTLSAVRTAVIEEDEEEEEE